MTELSSLFSKSFVAPEAYDAFFSVIGRLEGALDDENRLLASGKHEGLTETTRQKRQGFLELSRIMRSLESAIPSQDIVIRLGSFRQRLAHNSSLLTTYLNAAQEVTDIVVRVMREAESDGTYSSSFATIGYDDI